MRRIRRHLTYANVMVTILAFIVLTGGTAVALSGSNTVFTDDITDNQVLSVDVRDDTLASGGLVAADLRPDSVRGSEVAANSLTGSEVNEATLNFTSVGKVAGNVTDTDPNGDGPDTPVVGAGPSVTVDVPADGIVNVMARATLARSGAASCVVALAETATNRAALINQQLLYSDSTAPITLVSIPGRRAEFGDSFARTGWISFPATAGAHTYRLVYWAAGAANAGTCTFSNRTLWASVTG